MALLSLTAACTMVPVSEPEEVRFAPPLVAAAERQRQIVRAFIGLGWQIDQAMAGRVTATLAHAGKIATVAIIHDRERFAIHLASSQGFGQEGGRIDPAYNRLISDLKAAIQAQSSV